MTESENNRIKELTDRFFEGETTVEEERELYALYLEEDIPEEMEEYREMFRDFSAIIMTEEEKSLYPSTAHPVQETLPTNTHRLTAVKGKTRHKLLWPYISGVAAVLIAAVGISLSLNRQEEVRLAKLYGGSYMIINGTKIDKLTRIHTDIEQVLSEADEMEQTLSTETVIEKAEQDVLDGIDDEAERERIRKLME